MTMQTADCLVRLGGDGGNTVPKYAITASEIAVLQVIHGNDAVEEIRPVGTIETTHRAERARLAHAYGRMMDGEFRSPAVDRLFPGAAARLFETFDEIGMDDSLFAASGRVSSAAPLFTADGAAPVPAEASAEDDGIGDLPPASKSDELFA